MPSELLSASKALALMPGWVLDTEDRVEKLRLGASEDVASDGDADLTLLGIPVLELIEPRSELDMDTGSFVSALPIMGAGCIASDADGRTGLARGSGNKRSPMAADEGRELVIVLMPGKMLWLSELPLPVWRLLYEFVVEGG